MWRLWLKGYWRLFFILQQLLFIFQKTLGLTGSGVHFFSDPVEHFLVFIDIIIFIYNKVCSYRIFPFQIKVVCFFFHFSVHASIHKNQFSTFNKITFYNIFIIKKKIQPWKTYWRSHDNSICFILLRSDFWSE